MPNRQHGRSRSPAGPSRTTRTVPVSRSPAAVRLPGGPWSVPRPGTPAFTEPEVRRWPHPVEDAGSVPEPAMHYIRCALSYQNQLLADIKTLLEQLALDTEAPLPAGSAAAESEKG